MKALRPAMFLGLALAFLFAGPAGRTSLETESLVLPPYLESVVLDAFNEEPGVTVEVFAPGDLRHPLTPGVAGVEEIRFGDVLKALTIRRPAPGRWAFRKSPGSRVRILSQQFLPRGVLLEPASGEILWQHDRVFITYRVTDDNGAPLKELPGYPLTAHVVLVQPNGLRRPLAMERQPLMGPGVFRTLERTECSLTGRYRAEVSLSTRDLNGRTVKLFQDRWSGFSVRPAAARLSTLP